MNKYQNTGDQLTPILTKLLSEKNDVENKMDRVDLDLISIKAQIDEAKGDAKAFSEYSNPQWWSSVNSAARHKGLQRQKLQRQLGDLNSRIKALSAMGFEKLFIDCARDLLDRDTFTEIINKVNKQQDEFNTDGDRVVSIKLDPHARLSNG